MAKVLLINPHKDRRVNKIDEHPPLPLSLVFLGTAVEDDHDVKIFDRDVNLNDNDIMSLIKTFDPDIVGFSMMTSEMLLDYLHLGQVIKDECPERIIIAGGVHPTIEPESVLREPITDYILRGEAEETFLEFCNTFDKDPTQLGTIKNINMNPQRPLANMENIKLPNYFLVENLHKYESMYVNLSRGCPGNCTFCYSARMWGRDNMPYLRTFSKEKTKRFFQELVEKYNIRVFNIIDDNFIPFKSLALDICKQLEQYDVHFFAFGRADFLDEEVLKGLKRAGCHTIQIGIESGNQRILDMLEKRVTVKQNADAINAVMRNGIVCDASFMIGLPTETYSEMRDTINFVKTVRPDIVNLKIYSPLPGAPLFDDCVKQNLIVKPKTLHEWAMWTGGMVTVKHNVSKISDEDLMASAREVWDMNFYRTKFKRLKYWLQAGEIKQILKGTRKMFQKDGQGNIKVPLLGTIQMNTESSF